jgi:prevent-host-death family protein
LWPLPCYDVYTMAEVSVRELRNNLTGYLRRIEQGESVTVTRRGKPVATLEPVAQPVSDVDAAIWKMVREGKAMWSGKKFELPKRTFKLKGKGPTLSEMIIEDRG